MAARASSQALRVKVFAVCTTLLLTSEDTLTVTAWSSLSAANSSVCADRKPFIRTSSDIPLVLFAAPFIWSCKNVLKVVLLRGQTADEALMNNCNCSAPPPLPPTPSIQPPFNHPKIPKSKWGLWCGWMVPVVIVCIRAYHCWPPPTVPSPQLKPHSVPTSPLTVAHMPLCASCNRWYTLFILSYSSFKNIFFCFLFLLLLSSVQPGSPW